jgi:predicted metal-binding membrane protein
MTFSLVQRRRRDRGALDGVASTWVFIAGYLLTWTAFGLAAYGLYVGVRSLSIPELSWRQGGPYLAGSVLVAAAIYQLTPAKDACLRRCRGPLEFVLTQWREGPSGALRMGVVHGAWCVGCCWALMAALFALGVMSIPWMIVVAGLIAVEKLLPWKALANRTVAVALLVLGLGVALSPGDVPGLTLPDSPAATRAMRAMSGMHSMPASRGAPKMRVMPRGTAMPGMRGAQRTDSMPARRDTHMPRQ